MPESQRPDPELKFAAAVLLRRAMTAAKDRLAARPRSERFYTVVETTATVLRVIADQLADVARGRPK